MSESKRKAAKKHTDDDLQAARERVMAVGMETGRTLGRLAGFRDGWSAAKLEAFVYLGKQGREFTICPAVTAEVMPLVLKRLAELGVDVTGGKEWTGADYIQQVSEEWKVAK